MLEEHVRLYACQITAGHTCQASCCHSSACADGTSSASIGIQSGAGCLGCLMTVAFYARYQGNVSAALVLGGVDFRGPHLFTVYPHGSTDALPYATMGSGSLNAMAVFEDEYKCV